MRVSILSIAALCLSACSTFTPYQSASSDGYGFSEQRIEDNRYQVTFRGNSMTERERVENSLLYRAAELTLSNGYDYFIVAESDTDEKTTYSSTSYYPAFYGRYNFSSRRGRGVHHFPYYAYGFDWGYPSRNRWVTNSDTRYSARAYISMHRGAKPDENEHAFDARQVSDNLRAYVSQ